MDFLKRDNQPTLAYVYSSGDRADLPFVMFCGGYRSDMGGTKATYLEAQCRARGQSYVRFDYRGHGHSEGNFDDSTISDWTNDALAVFDILSEGRDVILVGSSMGGWISLLVAKVRQEQVRAFIGIAAAPDFTEDMYHNRFTEEQRIELKDKGVLYVPNDYSDVPYTYTYKFYEDGKANLLLNEKQSVDFPMCLIQGRKDVDVPYEWAERIKATYHGADCKIIAVDDGDHRLSRPQDLELIDRVLQGFSNLS